MVNFEQVNAGWDIKIRNKIFFLFCLILTFALQYLYIFLTISVEDVKITHNTSFKDNNCLIAMLITVVLFRRIHLRIFLRLNHFDSQPRRGVILAEVLESETEINTIRNGD